MAVFHNWLDQIWRSDERTLYGCIPAHIERFGSFSAENMQKIEETGREWHPNLPLAAFGRA